MSEVIKTETKQEPVGVEKVVTTTEVKPLTKEEVKVNQEFAEKHGNYDPVEEEKRNNEVMFAKDRASRVASSDIVAEVNAKIITDAKKKVADAQAELDAAEVTNAKALKAAEDAEKKAKDEADKAKADAKK